MDTSLWQMFETLHLHEDDVPWVGFEPGTETRVLHAGPSEGFIVTQLRAQPGVISPLHRHCGPVFAFTVQGSWGHDERFLYKPGTYIYEMPGVVHRFYGGPEVVEGLFISHGNIELIETETEEVSRVATTQDLLDGYLEACEAMGAPRPNLLT